VNKLTNEINETKRMDETSLLSTEDVVNLPDREIKWRAKYKMTKEALETTKLEAERENKQLLESINRSRQEKSNMEQQLVDAKLETMAVAAGITDLDLIKLIDKSSIKTDEQGNITGIKEAVDFFKKSKPYFFGSEKRTSSSTNIPTIQETSSKVFDAFSMTPQEFKEEMNKIKNKRGYFSKKYMN